MFQIKVAYEDYYVLGCNAMSSSKNVVTFQGNLLILSCVYVYVLKPNNKIKKVIYVDEI